MANGITELSQLGTNLSDATDRVKTIISTINHKLQQLPFGSGVWLTPIVGRSDFEIPIGNLDVDATDKFIVQTRDVIVVGYTEVEGKWQLAVQEKTLRHSFETTCEDEETPGTYSTTTTHESPQPLLTASPGIRAEAMGLIPPLVEKIKTKGHVMLQNFEAVERLAEQL